MIQISSFAHFDGRGGGGILFGALGRTAMGLDSKRSPDSIHLISTFGVVSVFNPLGLCFS